MSAETIMHGSESWPPLPDDHPVFMRSPREDGGMPDGFVPIWRIKEDRNAPGLDRHLETAIPEKELIIDIAQRYRHNPEKTQSTLYGVAKTQNHLNVLIHNPASSPHQIGEAARRYAQSNFLYSYMHAQLGGLRLLPLYFRLAHDNLVVAHQYVRTARNARRAAEFAALDGDKEAFQSWSYIGFFDEDNQSLIWEHYKQPREEYTEYKDREETMSASNSYPHLVQAAMGVAAVIAMESTSNLPDLPPGLDGLDPDTQIMRAHLLARRAAATQAIEQYGQIYPIPEPRKSSENVAPDDGTNSFTAA